MYGKLTVSLALKAVIMRRHFLMGNQMYDLEDLLWAIEKAKCARPGKLRPADLEFMDGMDKIAQACIHFNREPTISEKQEAWLENIKKRSV